MVGVTIVSYGFALSVPRVGTECAIGVPRVCRGRAVGDGPGPTYVQSMSKIDLSHISFVGCANSGPIVCHWCALSVLWDGTECAKGGQ